MSLSHFPRFMENDMRFADPVWLLVGAVVVTILFVLLVRAERLRARALALLAGSRLRPVSAALPSRLRRWTRVAVMTLAVALGFVAVARPQKGMHWETVERNGTDVLLVLDTSRSMDADDVKPSRLERAKLAIRDLVAKVPGDRVGLVAFAGDAVTESPLTLDHSALLETVGALDTSVIARGGTDIGHAIDVATNALATEPGHDKTMVLISDGEDLEGRGLDEAKKAAAAGITIETVGVGSPQGELVPARDEHGKAVGVVRDESGTPVRSKLDESGLRKIAETAHGTYRPLGADGRGLERLYDEALAPRAHLQASSRTHRVYSERFEIPLGLALAMIVFDSLLALPRRRREATRSVRSRRGVAAAAAAAAAAAMLLLGAPGVAHASVNDAEKAYASGKYDEALKQYEAESKKHPQDARLAFNLADAAYKAKKFDVAESALKRALAAADPTLQKDVLYNEGNALYRTGQGFGADARERTKEAWKSAIAAYDGALALNSKDEDARFNRDFVKRKLAELEQKEKNEPKPNPQQDQNKQDQKQDQKQGKSDKQDKGQQGNQGQQANQQGQGQQGNQGQQANQQGQGQQGNQGQQANQQGQQGNQGQQGQPQAGNGNPQQQPSPGNQPEKGNQEKKGESPNGNPQNANPQNANAKNANPQNGNSPSAQNGNQRSAGTPTTPAAAGSASGGDHRGPQPAAKLDEQSARALLGALKGEERHAVRTGTDAGASPDDDTPKKDW